jgi:creatinine amidohydrolase
MQRGELDCCIIPTAACEQHLEHLAMLHDWRSARHIAAAVAERLRRRVLVAEGLMAGVSEHHMTHPGTLTLQPGTFLAVLSDLIDSVVRAGFQNVLVLNGHGGNADPARAAWDQFHRRYQINLQFISYWDVLEEQDAQDLLQGSKRVPEDLPGHAQEFETAFALAAFPEHVRSDAIADQPDAGPAHADAETGHAFIERIVDRVARHVQKMIDGTSHPPVPPYHP